MSKTGILNNSLKFTNTVWTLYYTKSAHYGQVTRARMTQIMNLLLLAPDIQEKLLNLPQTTSGRDTVILRELQTIALEPDWRKQRKIWEDMKNQGQVLIV